MPILTNQTVGKVSQFHKALKAKFGQSLADLQVIFDWVNSFYFYNLVEPFVPFTTSLNITNGTPNFHWLFSFPSIISQTSCLNENDINFVQFLQDIANEHTFEVTYVDIEEKTYNGRYQCLVQLSTLPVAVCQGSGTTPKDARMHAARNALEYLKIMTKM